MKEPKPPKTIYEDSKIKVVETDFGEHYQDKEGCFRIVEICGIIKKERPVESAGIGKLH